MCLIRTLSESLSFSQALSDAHVFLFEERQRLLTLQAENDELRLQEIEDRKRIRQLLGTSAGPDTQQQQQQQQQQQLRHYSVDALLLKIESLQAQLNEQASGGHLPRAHAAHARVGRLASRAFRRPPAETRRSSWRRSA